MSNTYLAIVLTSSVLGLLAGFVMHRSDFCMAAMFRDGFLFRDAFLLRVLVLLVVVSMLAFEAGRASGLISLYPFPLLGPPSLASLIGGMVFGLGMVLAGGCVVGTLYRVGAGSAVSAVALIGLLVGSVLYPEVHEPWARFATATRLHPDGFTLSQAFGVRPIVLVLPLSLVGGYFLTRWWRQGRLRRAGFAQGYLQPWQAALIFSAIGLVSYIVVGMPLGITTAYTKLGSAIESVLMPEHVKSLAYLVTEPLHYTVPFSNTTLRGTPGPELDGIAAIQYPLIAGIMLGAAASAILLREFRFYYRVPVSHYVSALIGGVLLGLASRMTPGCNVWHLWGGVPILATQSLLFLIGLVPGAWLGSRLLSSLILRTKKSPKSPATSSEKDWMHGTQ